ncbi:hypothetical protein [Shewanella sp. SM23]|uniref:hypothetical protein n=1 Tax=Shewanella sp. SM23 TaxID=2912794 RepID=UPI0021DA943B|nr:hypothetical protein [Shewanella sp. SM23]MCU8083840.1 hypothetical protein [Shewanella sp. SM23]
MEVISKPEPPEAIVEIDGKQSWIEITDAFLDIAHAKGLTSGAADDVEHISDSGRLILEPDDTFRASLLAVIENKYDKKSMQKVASAHGPGILLVGIFTPFNSAGAVSKEEKMNVKNLVESKSLPIFSHIYVYDGTGSREFHLLYQKT